MTGPEDQELEDPHGECVTEIHKLKDQIRELNESLNVECHKTELHCVRVEGLVKQVVRLRDQLDAVSLVHKMRANEAEAAADHIQELEANLDEARKAWDGPETDDFIVGMRKEAAHQIARWGVSHDKGKSPPDWFWLIGFLAGKALEATAKGTGDKDNRDRALHHTISTAAVLLNWHAHILNGGGQYHPGTATPDRRTD